MNRRQNSFGPMPEESLQGFIFRVLVRTGYSEFATVLTNTGWGNRPSVPLAAKEEFDVFSRRELLRFFEQTALYGQKYSIFDSHFEHLFPKEDSSRYKKGEVPSFKDVFFPVKEKKQAGTSIPVKYCDECIQEHIEQNGFAVFKLSWNHQNTCELHLKPLSSIGYTYSFKDKVEAVKNVLNGALSSKHYKTEMHDFDARVDTYISFESTRLAPCAKSAIVTHLVANCKFYPSGYSELVDYGFLTKYGKGVFSKWQLRRALDLFTEDFYQSALEQDYKSTMQFLCENMELVKVNYVNTIVRSDYRWLLKCKTMDCSRCAVTNNIGLQKCSASRLIHIQKIKNEGLSSQFSLFPPSQLSEYLCDDKLRHLGTQVYDYQDEQGVKFGEREVRYQIERRQLERLVGQINSLREDLKSQRG